MHFYMRPIAWTIVRAVRAVTRRCARPLDYDDMSRVRSTDSAAFTLANSRADRRQLVARALLRAGGGIERLTAFCQQSRAEARPSCP